MMQSKEIQTSLNAMLEHIKNIFEFFLEYATTSTRGGPQLVMLCHNLLIVPDNFINSNLDDIGEKERKLKDLRDDYNTCVTSENYKMNRSDSR